MFVSADAENCLWKSYLDQSPSVLACRPALREKLEEQYWAVSFHYRRPSDRDLFVFVSGDGTRVLGEIHGR
jgi:hypothetical protein